MTREIKFRAKDFTGVWKCGFAVFGNETAVIIPKNADGTVAMDINFLVKRDTICQATGLHDKNGREIYEGDIVVISREPEGRRKKVPVRHVVTCRAVYDWDFEPLAHNVYGLSLMNHSDRYDSHRFEVIGNIYDNPELAKPYALNLPPTKSRRKKQSELQVEFVVKENPKPEPYVEYTEYGARLIHEVSQDEMDEAINDLIEQR